MAGSLKPVLSEVQVLKKKQEISYYKRIIEKLPGSSPFSLNSHLKLGELYTEIGDNKSAVKEYSLAATHYTQNGALVKALAVNKLMNELIPGQEDTSASSSALYFQHKEHYEPSVRNSEKTQSYWQGADIQPRTSMGAKMPEGIDSQVQERLNGNKGLLELTEEEGEEGEIASYLKQHPLFYNLSWAERQWLEENVTVYHFAEHSTILQKGSEQESLFIVLEGCVTIVPEEQEQHTPVMKTLGEGDIFGEVSLFTYHNSHASVVADTTCSVLEISRTVLAALIKKHPKIAKILEGYAARRGIENKLANVPLFSHLDPIERQKIAERLSPVSIKKGTVIIREGDTGDCMFLIKFGQVGVYTTLMDEDSTSFSAIAQEQLHLSTLKDGDFFGEQALITEERRNATIIALTDVHLLKFSKADLEIIVKHYPRVGEFLKKYHHQRTIDTMESLNTAFQQMISKYGTDDNQ